ncbi:hypothetical protein DEJ51_34220 [Streptomyces venezuelae]|uniref:Uncharacterized protein n=1 Tax=Streptomyces venezuelae TaxID=54571 RepID=A0A5P2DUI6_STRVZ|nr:hypothetical protein [Streptomyces venezuelae]QES58563.1 hypothetical protein DEJ51_34220 [Streptomyces venezuelae]
MYFNGAGRQRGHVLLIAGDGAARRRTVHLAPSANLAALAMVPASVLLGSELPTDTVCLDGVRDPNTVLARLRTAAATPGPLLLYLSGRLTADRRGRGLHLALAGTTQAAVRYTALPWEWLGGELRSRPAGLTTVLLDLAADKQAWPLLQEYGSLPAFPCAEVYGVVCPPGFAAGDGTVSGYTRHWIDQLRRSPVRPADVQLHALAAGAAGLPPGALVLPTARELGMRPGPLRSQPQPPQPDPQAPAPHGWQDADGPAGPAVPGHDQGPASDPGGAAGGDPRPYIHALAMEGRHPEAAALARAWEEHVRQTCGFSSPQAVQWAEIRADLARMAGDFPLATELWIGACRARLAGQGATDPEVHAAAAGALYCWTQLKDRAPAAESGPELVALLCALPTLDPRHLRLAQARLEALRAPGLPRAVPI